MKAIVYTQYGSVDVLKAREVEKPSPKDHEILIRIHAATATAGDCEIRSFTFPLMYRIPLRIMFGIFKPKQQILGQEFSGVVEEVGSSVTGFKKGDAVFGPTEKFGAYAEYICVSKDNAIALKPDNTSFEAAAAISTGTLNALHYLKEGNIQKGQKVLINGAAGNFGTYAVQLAKYYGTEVTAVDSSNKLDLLRNIGADYVIDYTKEDFTKNGKKYDLIFDVVGKSHFSRSVESLNENGHYVIAIPELLKMLRGYWVGKTSTKKVKFKLAPYHSKNLNFIKNLIASGTIKPIIDQQYSFDEIAEAHRYVESGQKKGNVVISMMRS